MYIRFEFSETLPVPSTLGKKVAQLSCHCTEINSHIGLGMVNFFFHLYGVTHKYALPGTSGSHL
jgi:hypothetical protein